MASLNLGMRNPKSSGLMTLIWFKDLHTYENSRSALGGIKRDNCCTNKKQSSKVAETYLPVLIIAKTSSRVQLSERKHSEILAEN